MPRSAMNQRRVLAATSISYVVVILDTSIVNIALEAIGHAFGTGIAGLQWVVNAYTLVFASLLLTGGTFGDRWGAKPVYFLGLALFTLASALCGFAPTLSVLVASRFLQGIGAALLVPCSLTLLNHAYPEPGERAGAIGVWAGWGGVALAAGPLIGGLLIHLLGWRSIFLVNVPIGLMGLWLTSRVGQDKTLQPSRHLDITGQIAVILALAGLVATLIEGPRFGWGSAQVLGGVVLSAIAWFAFLMIEGRRREPMLPLSFFKDRVFSGAMLVAMTTTLTFFGLIFVFSLYFQQVRNYSPLHTGIAFLPLTAVVTIANVASGRWARAYGVRWPVLAGIGCSMTGFVGMAFAAQASPYWLLALLLAAIGLGGGLVTPSVTVALMGTIEKGRAGIAAGVLNSARQTGAGLGVAIFGALLSVMHPFLDGMRVALSMAGIASFVSAVVWWFASAK